MVLEITESVLLEDLALAHSIVEKLKALSICVSPDDFRTDYSSLRHLQELSVDELKIDRSFVRSLGIGVCW